MTFEELELLPELLCAIERANYRQPTPVQAQAIPPALQGRDVLATAQTGTGKTAAFTLPLLQRLQHRVDDRCVLRALVLTPTRELAAQIHESFDTYGAELDLWHAAIFGGVSAQPQIKLLRKGVDTLIATPGRLLDLIERDEISLKDVEFFVLDEADRMLDMGFLPDVRRVIQRLPRKRQTFFFSATMPPEIRGLAQQLLHRPVEVAVGPQSVTADGVEDQRVLFVDKENKRRLALEVLRDTSIERAVLFSRTKHGADRIARALGQAGVEVAAIHGNKSQSARVRALEAFRSGRLRVLVATDLAARGIDVQGITHIINYDLPNIPETYVHRVGRAGRAGARGTAISFCDHEERGYLADIERLIGRSLRRVEDHGFPASQAAASPRAQAPRNERPARRRTSRGSAPRGGRGARFRQAVGQQS
ncbi:MAG: DEAD/DEAH box helicase [Myxococcales bacterium]|nr:DEAD/DEAH box helicase [Myxococcales bacterium]